MMAECDLCGERMETLYPLIWYLKGYTPLDSSIDKIRHVCFSCLEKCAKLHNELKKRSRGGR